MNRFVLAGTFALSASTCLAQNTTSPKPPAPPVQPQTNQAAASPQGGPANLCQELLTFMKAPPPKPAAPAGEAKPATTQQAAPAQQHAAPAQQSGSSQQGSSALAGTTHSGEGASTKPGTGTNSAQAVTGQQGVATNAPEPGKDKAAAGSAQNAPQKESRAAPIPPADVKSTPKESVLTIQTAEQLAAANDIAQCQKTARQMRVAGVDMPSPLIALAALDLQYQQKSGAAAQPSGAPNPATDGQGAASQSPAPK